MGMTTGWFGIPGAQGRWSTNVHIVGPNQEPICGQRLSSRQRFQWCSDGARLDMVECERCKKAAMGKARKGAAG
jgi:hypothetical protein